MAQSPDVRIVTETALSEYDTTLQSELSTTIDASRPVAYMDLMGKASGALPAARVTDSGHPYTLTVGTAGQPGYVIADEALDAVSGLAYLNTGPLAGPVRDFRMRVKWIDGGNANDRPAVMIVSENFFHPNSGVAVYANAAAHVLLYRNRFVFQKRAADGTSTDLKYWTYSTPLAFDVWHDFRFTWDGKQATVIDSLGTTHVLAYDAQVAAWWGKFATVETVSSATENRVLIRSWSTDPIVKIEPAAEVKTPPALGKMVKSPTTTTTVLTTSYATVETVSIVIPPSKMVTVWAMPNISALSDGVVYGQIDVGGHPTSVANMALLESQAWSGAYTFFGVCDCSAFTVGQTATVNIKLMATGTASFRKQTSGPPRRMPVHVTPVEAIYA